MTYHNDILCCTMQELLSFCKLHQIEYMLKEKQIERVRRACKGTPALIAFHSLPLEYREKLIEQNGGDPERTVKHQAFCDEIEIDMDAVAFYSNYKPAGEEIKKDRQRQYVNEASILNAIAKRLKLHLKKQSSGAKSSIFWQNACKVLPGIKGVWSHKLPTTEKNLKRKFEKYQEDGYRSLVNGNYGNQNTRIINEHLEELLKCIYTQSWNPNYIEVHRDYMAFVSGVKLLVSEETGEVYNPKDYEPISASSVRIYMRKWSNSVGTQKKRSNSRIGYNAKHRSYASLKVDYAGALLSMDDRDMPFKLKGTTKRVVGYFTADACSTAIIGWAFARPKMREDDPNGKGLNLIFDCFRNTFEQLEYYGVNMPAEVEVENHLMSNLKETTLKEGNLFPFVRFAVAENPQEKSIEGFFRILRYKYERKIKGFRARPHARSEFNQSRPNEEHVEYSFEQICEMTIEHILEYNNDLHPNQKKFPGKSRIEVFLEYQHPKLQPINWRDVARWIGFSVKTSVNRGEVRANNQKFLLPSPELMDKTGMGSECTAYWFKHQAGEENTIYLYRKDEFICEMTTKPTFHKARIEQDERDLEAMARMQSFTNKIDSHAKKVAKKLEKVTFINAQRVKESVEVAKKVEVISHKTEKFDYQKLTSNNKVYNLLEDL
nr:MAG TPA: transposase [Caudoviricetes sp.]